MNDSTSAGDAADSAFERAPPAEVPSNPFSCNICHRSYSRIDHLARHSRSHTQERPFVCSVCGKAFARVDLQKRHATTHTVDAVSPSKRRRQDDAPESTRQRAARACMACADAKIRCQGAQPCVRCERKSIPCQYMRPRVDADVVIQPSNRWPDCSVQGPIAQTSQAAFEDGSIDPNALSPRLESRHVSMYAESSSGPGSKDASAVHNAAMFDAVSFLPTPSTFDPGHAVPCSEAEHERMRTRSGDTQLPELLCDLRTSVDRANDARIDHLESFWPMDVLDIGMDLTYTSGSMNADAFLTMDSPSFPLPLPLLDEEDVGECRSGMTTPNGRRKVNIGAGTQAFQKSVWLWKPERADRAGVEEVNLALPHHGVTAERLDCSKCQSAHGQMSQVVYGKVLAMVLRTCEVTIYPIVVSSFPSLELISHIIHDFLSYHARQDVTWIHPATVEVNKEDPLFLAALTAYGATLSSVPEVKKLGFALQEAVRTALSMEFERDNSLTRELRFLQTYTLSLDIGLWSGDRRKMEIAESFAMPLITMVRRAGHFRHSDGNNFLPQADDLGEDLDLKWRSLAFHLFLRDARSSMSLLSQPLISYAEVTTNLPCSRELWLATTATNWKKVYTEQHGSGLTPDLTPSLRACINDSTPLFKSAKIVDVSMSLPVLIAAAWPLVWHYQEMRSTSAVEFPQERRERTLTRSSRHHEVEQTFQHIRLNAIEWLGAIGPAARLLHEQCLMHLRVSLVDVQLLAGKGGENEARRILPSLTAWAESSDARQAIYHAGQMIRAAEDLTDTALREASAVAVYHASVVCWAYSILTKCDNDKTGFHSSDKPTTFVRLDGDAGPDVQRFLVLGKGIPCIKRWQQVPDMGYSQNVPLSEQAEVMSTVTSVLQYKGLKGDRNTPSLVENLINLMQALGKAAPGKR